MHASFRQKTKLKKKRKMEKKKRETEKEKERGRERKRVREREMIPNPKRDGLEFLKKIRFRIRSWPSGLTLIVLWGRGGGGRAGIRLKGSGSGESHKCFLPL